PSPAARHPLSLHDALPIFLCVPITELGHPFNHIAQAAGVDRMFVERCAVVAQALDAELAQRQLARWPDDLEQGGARILFLGVGRSEEHTSELQSRENLVCR